MGGRWGPLEGELGAVGGSWRQLGAVGGSWGQSEAGMEAEMAALGAVGAGPWGITNKWGSTPGR